MNIYTLACAYPHICICARVQEILYIKQNNVTKGATFKKTDRKTESKKSKFENSGKVLHCHVYWNFSQGIKFNYQV